MKTNRPFFAEKRKNHRDRNLDEIGFEFPNALNMKNNLKN